MQGQACREARAPAGPLSYHIHDGSPTPPPPTHLPLVHCMSAEPHHSPLTVTDAPKSACSAANVALAAQTSSSVHRSGLLMVQEGGYGWTGPPRPD